MNCERFTDFLSTAFFCWVLARLSTLREQITQCNLCEGANFKQFHHVMFMSYSLFHYPINVAQTFHSTIIGIICLLDKPNVQDFC